MEDADEKVEEGTRERFLVVWMGGINAAKLVPIRRDIEDQITLPREQVEIDLWIESGGGDAHAAYKLALLLRHSAVHVRVVIPDYAKSAATLLSLVGHEIFMAPAAELGPLDAQIPEEGSIQGAISALNIARAADEVARDAVQLAGRGGGELRYITGLSRAETLNAMLKFSSEFSEPLVRQLDPRLVHQSKELLRVTARYAERLLEDTARRGRASEIATRLVQDFPTHGFVISYDDAESLGFPVRPIDEYDKLDLVREVHRGHEDSADEMIVFMPMPGVGLEDAADEVADAETGAGSDQDLDQDVTVAADNEGGEEDEQERDAPLEGGLPDGEVRVEEPVNGSAGPPATD